MYIEDIPGFSIKTLSAIEGGKYLTVQSMLNAKLRIVGQELSEGIGGLLSEIYIENSVDALISKNFGNEYFEQADGTPGLVIEKYPTALSNLFVPNIYFKSYIAVQGLVITVTDGFSPQAFTVDAEAGQEVSVEVNYSTSQKKITITCDSSILPSSAGVAPYTSDIAIQSDFCFDDRLLGCNTDCDPCGHRYLKIHGLDFAGAEKTVYYGIRADVQLVCDREKMVCLMAPQNKTLILYSTAVKVLDEIIMGERFNFFAMASKDLARELKAELEGKIADLWFTNGPGIKNLLVNSEKKCFKCTGLQYYERVP